MSSAIKSGTSKLGRINSKQKGNRFELAVVKDLRQWFPFAKTSRLASKLLDDCGVDIAGVPFNIQCKNGYENKNFSYRDLYLEFKRLIAEKFDPSDPVHKHPFLLIHKKGRKDEDVTVTMTWKDFCKLMDESRRPK